MFGFRRKGVDLSQRVEAFNQGLEALHVRPSLEENLALMKALFQDVDIMRYRSVIRAGRADVAVVFSDGLVNSEIINENILRPLMSAEALPEGPGRVARMTGEVVHVSESILTGDFKEIVGAVAYGDTVLFAEGCAEAALLNTKGFPVRSIMEPDSEKTCRAPGGLYRIGNAEHFNAPAPGAHQRFQDPPHDDGPQNPDLRDGMLF
jgi:spore germination protein KA